MKNLSLLAVVAVSAFSVIEATLWFPDFSDFFPSHKSAPLKPEPLHGWGYLLYTPHDESYETYFGIKSDSDGQDPFDRDLPVLTDERKAQLAKFYSRKGKCTDRYEAPFDPNLRAYRPFTKAGWLFVMEHYSWNWDTRSEIKKFQPEDIANFEHMKELVFSGFWTFSFNEVYLEGLCNIAEVDSEAAKVMDYLMELFKD